MWYIWFSKIKLTNKQKKINENIFLEYFQVEIIIERDQWQWSIVIYNNLLTWINQLIILSIYNRNFLIFSIRVRASHPISVVM